MRFSFGLAAGAFALLFALNQAVIADEYADEVEDFSPVGVITGDDQLGGGAEIGTDALGKENHTVNGGAINNSEAFTTLGCAPVDGTLNSDGELCDDPLGSLTLNFTDNICRLTSGDDLEVYEVGPGGVPNELTAVTAGLDGGGTIATGNGDLTDTGVDLTGTEGAWFNQVEIEAPDFAGATDVPGADIDAVACTSILGVGDILKEHTGFEDIDVGLGAPQDGFSFTIEITNDTGTDGALNNLKFIDSVPGEFDLDSDAEDALNGAGGDDCIDGECDGIDTTGASLCIVTADTSEGAKKKNRAKLEPEIITIEPDDLDNGESCLIEVFVMTDTKNFPKGKSPAYTPTSCPEVPGVIVLNDGVRVFDDSMNLLLHDDTSLSLACNQFTD